MQRNSPLSHTALLLTGGGARAAYQVGVVKAIAKWCPRVAASPFSIYCGTSAGAINATSLACDSSCFRLGVKRLEWLWSRLHTEDVFHSEFGAMFGFLAKQFFSRFQASYHQASPFGLLNNRPLRSLLERTLQYRKIELQIARNHLRGLAITASNYQNSKSVTFFQGRDEIAPWSRNRTLGMQHTINTEHLLASSAIPMVFPASQIGHQYYGDGSVHQISPLYPALKLGAQKILIIDLTPKRDGEITETQAPSLAHLGGHLMEAIFADTLSADIDHLSHFNQIIGAIESEQAKRLNLHPVEVLQISPPPSFEPIVQKHYHHMPLAARTLMRMLGISPADDAAITSYLLFEPSYLQELILMGYQKAHEHEQELRHFLGETYFSDWA